MTPRVAVVEWASRRMESRDHFDEVFATLYPASGRINEDCIFCTFVAGHWQPPGPPAPQGELFGSDALDCRRLRYAAARSGVHQMNLPSIRVKARKRAHGTQTFIRPTLKTLVGAYAALFAVTFPVAPFFDEALCACSNSARFNSQRRFVASMILFLPAALSLR